MLDIRLTIIQNHTFSQRLNGGQMFLNGDLKAIIWDRTVTLLQGVVTAATSLIIAMAQKNPEELKVSIPLAVSRLGRVSHVGKGGATRLEVSA